MPCTPRKPTQQERQRLVEAYARLKFAAVHAPYRTQVRLHEAYRKALASVLRRLCADALSPENERALDDAASRWWAETHKAGAGPGRDW